MLERLPGRPDLLSWVQTGLPGTHVASAEETREVTTIPVRRTWEEVGAPRTANGARPARCRPRVVAWR
jgi:hypothetical protein